MGAESARKYNYNQAKNVANSIGRIIDRLNPRYVPHWMMSELLSSYHMAQCIQEEYLRVMIGFGDKLEE